VLAHCDCVRALRQLTVAFDGPVSKSATYRRLDSYIAFPKWVASFDQEFLQTPLSSTAWGQNY